MNARHKVALTKLPAYSSGTLEAVRRLLLELGGMGAFVKPGQSVLLKPNLLSDNAPEEAVTTHPEIVRALIRLVREQGAKPFVADSPASAVKLERVWERTGFRAMCSEEDVPLVNLEREGSVEFDVNGCRFNIARPAIDADVIINAPKVKTHSLTVLTAAMKNMYGVLPGFQKTQLHCLHPNLQEFGNLIVKICEKLPPQLNVADAVVGMEGDGPSSGSPVHLGFLAASSDAAALDLALCRILRINPNTVPYLRSFSGKRAGAGKSADIEILGAAPDDVAPASFRTPGTLRARLIPGALVRVIRPYVWIRPRFSDSCVACGRCVEACPVEALSGASGQRPELDPNKCIECCCCHEICPEKAISMAQSPLLNFLRRGKMP